jgi:hypothetical protein
MVYRIKKGVNTFNIQLNINILLEAIEQEDYFLSSDTENLKPKGLIKTTQDFINPVLDGIFFNTLAYASKQLKMKH